MNESIYTKDFIVLLDNAFLDGYISALNESGVVIAIHESRDKLYEKIKQDQKEAIDRILYDLAVYYKDKTKTLKAIEKVKNIIAYNWASISITAAGALYQLFTSTTDPTALFLDLGALLTLAADGLAINEKIIKYVNDHKSKYKNK